MTQHINTHFKGKGANSIFTNNNYTLIMNHGDWNEEETAYLIAVYNGQITYNNQDPNNPFSKNSASTQQLTKPAPLAAQLVEGDYKEEEEEDEDRMVIDENPGAGAINEANGANNEQVQICYII